MTKYTYNILHIPTASFLVHRLYSYVNKHRADTFEITSLKSCKMFLEEFVLDYRNSSLWFENDLTLFLDLRDGTYYRDFQRRLPALALSKKEFEILRFEKVFVKRGITYV